MAIVEVELEDREAAEACVASLLVDADMWGEAYGCVELNDASE